MDQDKVFWKINIMDIITIVIFVFTIGSGYASLKSEIEALKEIRLYDINNLKESIHELKTEIKDVVTQIKETHNKWNTEKINEIRRKRIFFAAY